MIDPCIVIRLYTWCIKKATVVFDNYSEIPRSIALADMTNEREHQT